MTTAELSAAPAASVKEFGLRARTLMVARRDPVGLAATAIAGFLILAAVLAPLLAPADPTALVAAPRLPPGMHHLFGTDQLGRDVLSRTIYGARQTLTTAVLSTAFASMIGIPLGVFAGYMARWRGATIMRLMDILLAFPGLLLALVVVTVLGPGVGTVVVAVGVSYTPIFARVVYGSTQAVRSQDFIAAAKVVGCSPARIMTRHIFPVLATELLVLVSSAIGWTTLLAATLNFLGFGTQPPGADWGADLAAGKQYIADGWWISAAPGLAITVTILVSNYIGDFLASILDPDRLSRRHSKVKDTSMMPAGED